MTRAYMGLLRYRAVSVIFILSSKSGCAIYFVLVVICFVFIKLNVLSLILLNVTWCKLLFSGHHSYFRQDFEMLQAIKKAEIQSLHHVLGNSTLSV